MDAKRNFTFLSFLFCICLIFFHIFYSLYDIQSAGFVFYHFTVLQSPYIVISCKDCQIFKNIFFYKPLVAFGETSTRCVIPYLAISSCKFCLYQIHSSEKLYSTLSVLSVQIKILKIKFIIRKKIFCHPLELFKKISCCINICPKVIFLFLRQTKITFIYLLIK